MTILAFDEHNKNMNLFDNENNKKSINNVVLIDRKPNIGVLFQNKDDMALIASWVYQKGEKTQIYYNFG